MDSDRNQNAKQYKLMKYAQFFLRYFYLFQKPSTILIVTNWSEKCLLHSQICPNKLISKDSQEDLSESL